MPAAAFLLFFRHSPMDTVGAPFEASARSTPISPRTTRLSFNLISVGSNEPGAFRGAFFVPKRTQGAPKFDPVLTLAALLWVLQRSYPQAHAFKAALKWQMPILRILIFTTEPASFLLGVYPNI